MKKTEFKLDMKNVLGALDRQDLEYYDSLTSDHQKAYSVFVIMRYMSSLPNNDPLQQYAILAANDLVNIGFGDLAKYPDLQHRLLCCAGLGEKKYRPWIPVGKGRRKSNDDIYNLVNEIYPHLNSQEINLMIQTLSTEQLTDLATAMGMDEKQISDLLKDFHSR